MYPAYFDGRIHEVNRNVAGLLLIVALFIDLAMFILMILMILIIGAAVKSPFLRMGYIIRGVFG